MTPLSRSGFPSRATLVHVIRWPMLGMLLLACAGCTAGAQSDIFEPIGRRVAGSYLLEVQHVGFPLAHALVTLNRDGGFISSDTSDLGAGIPGVTRDSPVHGTWKPSGLHSLTATTMYFGFDVDGIPQWFGRTKGRFTFDRDYMTGKGDLIVERFRLDQDPLDPNEIPHDTLRATLTARRIVP